MRKWIKLDPELPVETPHGFAYAHFIIDNGMEHNLYWLCGINEGDKAGQFWLVDNSDIRLSPNWTLKRPKGSKVR